MKKFLVAGIFGLSLLASSAYSVIRIAGEDEAHQRININIPTDKVTLEDATTLLNFLSNSIREGQSEVNLADALSNVEIPEGYKGLVDKVLASRDPLALVECSGRSCKISSTGRALDFKIDGVSLPVVGVPQVFLSKDINIYARVADDNLSAEICRIEGIAFKISFIKSPLDGAALAIEDGAVKTLLIDAGIGGTFPTNTCDFVSAAEQSDVAASEVK